MPDIVLLELLSGEEPVWYEYNKAAKGNNRTLLNGSAVTVAAEGVEEGLQQDLHIKESFPVDAIQMLMMLCRCKF